MWSAAACRRFPKGSLFPVEPMRSNATWQASLPGKSGGKPPRPTWLFSFDMQGPVIISFNPDMGMIKLNQISAWFKSVGDPMRLRMLHLLTREELAVGEIVRILDLPQSTVSRHLKALREAGLVADRPMGPSAYYRATLVAEAGDGGEASVHDALADLLARTDLAPVDRRRLDEALAMRASQGDDFFDRMGLRWDALRESCFGRTFHLEALVHLLPREWTVADLGVGTGYLLPTLARHFRRVIGVDVSRPMLELSAHRAGEGGLENVELRHGRLEALPLADGEIDLAIALLIIHHVSDVRLVTEEIARALRSGGRLLAVEIHPHDNEGFRQHMADRHRGLAPEQLAQQLRAADFERIDHWDYPYLDRPEHELAPLPPLYALVATKMGNANEK